MMTEPEILQALQGGMAHHQAGRLGEAEALYRQVLRHEAENPDALHLLGVAAHQRGRHEEAVGLITRAVAREDSVADFHNNLGEALLAMGRVDEAVARYRRALELEPERPDLLYNLGRGLTQLGRKREAAESYRQAVRSRPDLVQAHANLGSLLLEMGEPAEASQCLHRAAELGRGDAKAWNGVGLAYSAAGRGREAADAYRRALALQPDWAELHNTLGATLQALGEFEAAAQSFEMAVQLRPREAAYLANWGTALHGCEKREQALRAYEKAIALVPDSGEMCSNFASLLDAADRTVEALTYHRKAVALTPRSVLAHSNLAINLKNTGALDESLASARRALELDPAHAEAHVTRGFVLLQQGKWAQGFTEYEWRLRRPGLPPSSHSEKPLWDGSDVSGKTVLLHAEQGMGDTIQFVRYAPLLAARGAKVVVEGQAPLRELLDTLAGVSQVISAGEAVPEFDVRLPMMSLPHRFGTTLANVPAQAPYLHADPGRSARWRSRLASDPARVRVGLAWAGNPSHPNDRNRSMRLEALAALTEAAQGLSFFSLQKGEAAAQAADPPAGLHLIDVSSDLNDFTDTAALLENLDLVISVDTSIVHLAGAMNLPVWTLLAFSSDWRWMLGRNDSPWYPSMVLFRQTNRGDWAGVARRVAEALKQFVASSSAR